MKCFQHPGAEAVAICAWCGRAVCRDCLPAPNAPRVVCSGDCAAALERAEQAIQLIVQRSAQNARASAFYCYLCAALSAAAAVAAWFMFQVPFLIYFTGGCAVVLTLSGVWYQRGARKRDAPTVP